MSTKHYFPETAVNSLVPRALKALVTANPGLELIESERVVVNKTHNRANVSVIGGGGSGHEPAWSGYVGDGLLSAVACGDIFASPSMKQVMTACLAAPSDKGIILMITNYTGDKLHFGLAAERLLASGSSKRIAVLPATDDVSIGRSKCNIVGRRGMPGHIITMKIVAEAAARNYDFDRCLTLGKAVNAQLVSIGSALDHCHVPGRQNHDTIPDDVCIVGAGIHNEPGAQKVSPFPPVEDLVGRLLQLLLSQDDTERAFVKFDAADKVALVINNYGGLSTLEVGALTDEITSQLSASWNIKPEKIFCGIFESSLNGPGFSISLCNLTAAARESNSTTEELLEFLDAPTSAPCWPNTIKSTKDLSKSLPYTNGVEKEVEIPASEDITVDPTLLERAVRTACDRAIASEPDLTKWDMIMGDGDCGEAVEGVSKSILKLLEEGVAQQGSVLKFVYSIIHAVDEMGGTLGAIFGIYLSALLTSLRAGDDYANACFNAAESLKKYTGAREGDRTVMDVLLPFAAAFKESGKFPVAVKVAREKAEATRFLKPKFGRASYVGQGGKEQEVPDPGAWALMELLEGLLEGMNNNM